MNTLVNPLLYESAKVLLEGENHIGQQLEAISLILEDTSSPVTRKYHEKMLQAVVNKSHIDFGDIPKSEGDIRRYVGYNSMMETLQVMRDMCEDHLSNKFIKADSHAQILKYVETIERAVGSIAELHTSYENGFTQHNTYVMLEYCTYTYTCVEATTALIYQFVEFIKSPDMITLQIDLRNTKMRANAFYFDQLARFNQMMETNSTTYRKMLDTMSNGGRNNFFGLDDGLMVGSAAILMIAVSIIPITRELIYHFYHLRGNLANSLELQATFLEMNRACVEANQNFTEEKKKKVLKKQEVLRNKLLKLSEMLRVKAVKANEQAKKEIKSENKKMTVQSLKDDVSNSPMSLQFF